MHIIVYKCTGCGKMHYDKSNMRRHIHVVCRGASLEKFPGVVVVECAPLAVPSLTRAKPGPKPVDIAAAWRGRIPAFEGGDDDRIDAAFASGLVDRLLAADVIDIPVMLFDALWSTRAPEPFQSLIMYRNAIHEIDRLDDETGEIAYVSRGTLTKQLVREMAVYTLELAYAIAKDSVPTRCPEKRAEAAALLGRLRAPAGRDTDGSLRELLKQNSPDAARAVSMLRDAMVARCPTCYSM